MKYLLKLLAAASIASTLVGCGAVDGYKYMLTGQQAEPPARTIEAAQAQFNDGSLIVGQSTEADLKALLGSPAEIKKESGNKVHVYMKNVSTQGVSVDVGTTYVASYTISKGGKLTDKEYAARPMGNPLTGQ